MQEEGKKRRWREKGRGRREEGEKETLVLLNTSSCRSLPRGAAPLFRILIDDISYLKTFKKNVSR